MGADYGRKTETQLDFFEALGVQAESIISRLAKARHRAESGDRLGLITERRIKGGGDHECDQPAASVPERPGVNRSGEANRSIVDRVRSQQGHS